MQKLIHILKKSKIVAWRRSPYNCDRGCLSNPPIEICSSCSTVITVQIKNRKMKNQYKNYKNSFLVMSTLHRHGVVYQKITHKNNKKYFIHFMDKPSKLDQLVKILTGSPKKFKNTNHEIIHLLHKQ